PPSVDPPGYSSPVGAVECQQGIHWKRSGSKVVAKVARSVPEVNMGVVWTATLPESGRFSPFESCSKVSDLSYRFNELRSRGQGYLELRLEDSAFPQLTLGFRNDHAVIHVITNAEQMSLVVGDGTVPPD